MKSDTVYFMGGFMLIEFGLVYIHPGLALIAAGLLVVALACQDKPK